MSSIHSLGKVKAPTIDQLRFYAIEEEIERLGGWIRLKSGAQIMASGLSQKLVALALDVNPSYFKEERYCPGAFEVVVTPSGAHVPVCRDLPATNMKATSSGAKNSDEELIAAFERIYQSVGQNPGFRRQKRAEFFEADTEDGTKLKTKELIETGRFMPYYQISNQSPSGERQPRSLFENEANEENRFRRSGVLEWAGDMDGSDRALVGGSWGNFPEDAVSGVQLVLWPTSRSNVIGPPGEV